MRDGKCAAGGRIKHLDTLFSKAPLSPHSLDRSLPVSLLTEVHGSLARAGKVKGQTPKVEKQEKNQQPHKLFLFLYQKSVLAVHLLDLKDAIRSSLSIGRTWW